MLIKHFVSAVLILLLFFVWCGVDENHRKFWSENLERCKCLGDLGTDGQ